MAARDDVNERVEAVEAAYEFFHSYAARGLTGIRAVEASAELRGLLLAAAEALEGMGDSVRAAAEGGGDPHEAWTGVLAALERDAASVAASLRLVASQAAISSELINNLMNSVRLKSVLWDLYLVDQILES